MTGVTKPEACTMVIFGAAGDLTKRLLVPALYNLAQTGLIPEEFALVGVDIGDFTAEQWTGSLSDMLKSFTHDAGSEDEISAVDVKSWGHLTQQVSYVRGDFTQASCFAELERTLKKIESGRKGPANRLFYLAVADRFFAPIVAGLGTAGLVRNDADTWRRVIIEKPFGHDLESAKALNSAVLRHIAEDQVYRIDHFLGKENVQNIMALRFANGLFEPLWNRDHIDHVQITVAETVGVEGRGKFYEQTGALRDMVPNHVFQLVGMIAMEPPVGFSADAVRNKKCDVFSAMRPVRAEDAVRAQYSGGSINGHAYPAYRDEPNVSKDSNVETYVALRLAIDNWRWAGVPFFVRTGKRMACRMTEIAIVFKRAPLTTFQDTPIAKLPPSTLVLRIQPDEGVAHEFQVKRPGPTVDVSPVTMDFRYSDWFPPAPNVGYETLLFDCMMGDQTLFQRADMVEAAWRAVEPLLNDWSSDKTEIIKYEAGSEGPSAADVLIGSGNSSRNWRPIALNGGPRCP